MPAVTSIGGVSKSWADAIRKKLGLPETVPVRFSKFGTKIFVTDPDVKAGIPRDERHCAVARSYERQTGLPIAVCDRKVFVCEKDGNGKLAVLIYTTGIANTHSLKKFDDTQSMMEHGFPLWPWPTSWRPAHRKKLRKARQLLVEKGEWVPSKRKKAKKPEYVTQRIASYSPTRKQQSK